MPAQCPRPDKRVYASKAAAKLALRRGSLHGRDTLHAYRCPGGHFHIGHKLAQHKLRAAA